MAQFSAETIHLCLVCKWGVYLWSIFCAFFPPDHNSGSHLFVSMKAGAQWLFSLSVWKWWYRSLSQANQVFTLWNKRSEKLTCFSNIIALSLKLFRLCVIKSFYRTRRNIFPSFGRYFWQFVYYGFTKGEEVRFEDIFEEISLLYYNARLSTVLAMASNVSEKDVQLPYHLDTMTTGSLPTEPMPQTVACHEVKKEDKGKYCDSLVGKTFYKLSYFKISWRLLLVISTVTSVVWIFYQKGNTKHVVTLKLMKYQLLTKEIS